MRLVNIATMDYTVLPLWGELDGVFLFLVHESNFRNRDPRYKFRRVLLFASHPQHIFYQQAGIRITVQQDKIISTAVRVAGASGIPLTIDYFQRKRWMRLNAINLFLRTEVEPLGLMHE